MQPVQAVRAVGQRVAVDSRVRVVREEPNSTMRRDSRLERSRSVPEVGVVPTPSAGAVAILEKVAATRADRSPNLAGLVAVVPNRVDPAVPAAAGSNLDDLGDAAGPALPNPAGPAAAGPSLIDLAGPAVPNLAGRDPNRAGQAAGLLVDKHRNPKCRPDGSIRSLALPT